MWGNAGRFMRSRNTIRRSIVMPSESEDEGWEETSSSDSAEMACSERTDRTDETEVSSQAPDLLSITRRRRDFGILLPNFVVQETGVQTPARDISSIQELWREHAAAAAKLFPKSAWRILNAVHTESKTTQTKVLRAVVPLLSPGEKKFWPCSRKSIDDKFKRLGSFFSRVTRRLRVDLSHHNLPGVGVLSFTFMDPIYAWATCARKLSRTRKLHFEYRPRFHPSTNENLYGTSVSCGGIMLESVRRCPTAPSYQLLSDGVTTRGMYPDAAHTHRF